MRWRRADGEEREVVDLTDIELEIAEMETLSWLQADEGAPDPVATQFLAELQAERRRREVG